MNTATLIQLLLTILGFAIPDEERQNGEFGAGTREAVRRSRARMTGRKRVCSTTGRATPSWRRLAAVASPC